MTIDSLVLHNFGLYAGRQVLDLRPQSDKKPVVLIGGMNGEGKTTILDALQLGLYGKLARCSNRGNLAYFDYLRRCVHKGVPDSEGAAIEVTFRHISQGVEHTYQVKRLFLGTGKGFKEELEVVLDGRSDPTLSEQWQGKMEELLPVRIAHLFFFDGEKIEGFADPATCTELLSTAVHSLLGLDLVDQLQADLGVLERKKKVDPASRTQREEIHRWEVEIRRLEEELSDQTLNRGELQNQLDRFLRDGEAKDMEFQRLGGDLLERQRELELRRDQLAQEQHQLEDQLRDVAMGPSPLFLLGDLLTGAIGQAHLEREAAVAGDVVELLTDRDQHTLAKLALVAPGAVDLVTEHLRLDREERRNKTRAQVYLDLGKEAYGRLTALPSVLEDTLGRTRDLLERDQVARRNLEDQERTLSSIPAASDVAAIMRERELLRAQIADLRHRLDLADAGIEKARRELELSRRRHAGSLEKLAREELDQSESVRFLHHSERARLSLARFRRSVVERHTGRISAHILESLRSLLRKDTLVTDLSIDSETFQVRMKSPDGLEILPDRLSAGERQLLAVSILWGLAKASNRRLPVVVDTPMGRLDGIHRNHLVDFYLPSASHQVILLSTDQEIDEPFYHRLQPHLGGQYRLLYDDEVRATTVKDGYFWEANS